MSNGTMHRKSTLRSCCLHDSGHAGKPVLLFLAHVPKNVLIIITHAPELNDSFDKGVWSGLVWGTWVLKNMYVEHVLLKRSHTSDLAEGQNLKQP